MAAQFPSFESRTVTIDGINIHYVCGGSGPPLVLLHGIGSAAVSFCHQLDGLSADFRVIAWDAPGYGGSTPLATSELDPGGYAAALKCFLASLAMQCTRLISQARYSRIASSRP